MCSTEEEKDMIEYLEDREADYWISLEKEGLC